MKENPVLQKSYQFALAVIAVTRELERLREFNLSRQLFRSGTSIGANVEEAQAAQSRPDFQSKMSIASKEARETRYWLRLLSDSTLIAQDQRAALTTEPLAQCEEIIRMLTSIVKTTASGD